MLRDDLKGILAAPAEWFNGSTKGQAGLIAQALSETWFAKLDVDELGRRWGESGQYVLQFLHLAENFGGEDINPALVGGAAPTVKSSFFPVALPWLEQRLFPLLHYLFDFEVETQSLLLVETELFKKKKVKTLNIQRHFLREASLWHTDGMGKEAAHKLPQLKKYGAYTPTATPSSKVPKVVDDTGVELWGVRDVETCYVQRSWERGNSRTVYVWGGGGQPRDLSTRGEFFIELGCCQRVPFPRTGRHMALYSPHKSAAPSPSRAGAYSR